MNIHTVHLSLSPRRLFSVFDICFVLLNFWLQHNTSSIPLGRIYNARSSKWLTKVPATCLQTHALPVQCTVSTVFLSQSPGVCQACRFLRYVRACLVLTGSIAEVGIGREKENAQPRMGCVGLAGLGAPAKALLSYYLAIYALYPRVGGGMVSTRLPSSPLTQTRMEGPARQEDTHMQVRTPAQTLPRADNVLLVQNFPSMTLIPIRRKKAVPTSPPSLPLATSRPALRASAISC